MIRFVLWEDYPGSAGQQIGNTQASGWQTAVSQGMEGGGRMLVLFLGRLGLVVGVTETPRGESQNVNFPTHTQAAPRGLSLLR